MKVVQLDRKITRKCNNKNCYLLVSEVLLVCTCVRGKLKLLELGGLLNQRMSHCPHDKWLLIGELKHGSR